MNRLTITCTYWLLHVLPPYLYIHWIRLVHHTLDSSKKIVWEIKHYSLPILRVGCTTLHNFAILRTEREKRTPCERIWRGWTFRESGEISRRIHLGFMVAVCFRMMQNKKPVTYRWLPSTYRSCHHRIPCRPGCWTHRSKSRHVLHP